MRVISFEEASQRTLFAVSTLYDKVKTDPEFPQPVQLGPRTSGFVEAEIDAWIERRAAARELPKGPRSQSPGRAKFWEDVRAGLRLHPRTVGRLKREAEEAQSTGVAVAT